MLNPVTIQYMSREEIERLLFSFSADKDNEQAQAFEALARRLLYLLEQSQDR
ncbi:cell developmental protein SirA [Bermanella marisrubri]|uniref:Cell developmental protein SirA n=1 Tax=Bermanella marisrubri TaxID=207949 RepID=Q1N6X3_9GAMM|nr:hypothetical protein [Bermanella marisrubri]EAT13469.1 cell developmental protein SirA [Oceanobacter sp. RED65] [Bermanella marisrubri]QIZ84272.1 cell developmental protein SirA [Bermanella marisrubri]